MTEAVFLSASVPVSDPRDEAEFGLSIARSRERWAKTADVVAISSAVAALVHVVLGRRLLVWGGHPAITPMIWEIAQSIDVDYGAWVHLYQSLWFEEEFPEDNERFRNVTYTPKLQTRQLSLTRMRSQMFTENIFETAVFIGGMDGVVEEIGAFERTIEDGRTVPIISAGGASQEIGEERFGKDTDLSLDFDYVRLFHRRLGVPVSERRFRSPTEQPVRGDDRRWRPPSL